MPVSVTPYRTSAAENAAQETARQCGFQPPLVLGVTVLTSMDKNTLAEIGCEANPARQVERMANLAIRAGLRGLVEGQKVAFDTQEDRRTGKIAVGNIQAV